MGLPRRMSHPALSLGQIERVAGRLEIIALPREMAIEFGLTGWDKGAATACCGMERLASGSRLRAAAPIEEQQAIAQVRQIIEQYGDSQIQSLADSAPTLSRSATGSAGGRTQQMDLSGTLRQRILETQICAGLNPQKVAKSLSGAGCCASERPWVPVLDPYRRG